MSETKNRFIKTFGGKIHTALYVERASKVQSALDGIDNKVEAFRAEHKFKPGIDSKTAIPDMKARFAALQQDPNDKVKYEKLKNLKKEARLYERKMQAYCKHLGALLDQWNEQRDDPVVSDLAQMLPADFKKLFRTAGKHGFDLTSIKPAEAVAVFQYTGNAYRPLNKLLLGIADPPIVGQELAELKAVHDLTVAAMKKMPDKPVTSTRGEFRWNGDTAQYTEGNVFAITAFWSTGVGFKFKGEWQITIDGKTGKDVQGLSANPKENEVLFPPGTKFKVLDVNFVQSDGSRIEVSLQEV